MKKIALILLAILMLCSCMPENRTKIDHIEGIHYPYPMTIFYGDSSFNIPGTISSWNFPGSEEYDFYAIEAELEHPLENENIFSFSVGEEKAAKLVFNESVLCYEVRRWKVEADYLEDEIAGYELDDESEKVETEDGVFEIQTDGGIYVYEVHAYYEYGDCYYVFRIESSDDWGITLSVSNVTPSGATLIISQNGGNPTGELNTGSYYRIEYEDEELAFAVEGDIGWTSEAYIIPKGGSYKTEINWEWLYGELEPGTYRIFKNVMDFRGTGDYDTKEYSAEFVIE